MSEVYISVLGLSSKEEEVQVEQELSEVFGGPAEPYETLSGLGEAVGFIVGISKIDLDGAATRFQTFLRKHFGLGRDIEITVPTGKKNETIGLKGRNYTTAEILLILQQLATMGPTQPSADR